MPPLNVDPIERELIDRAARGERDAQHDLFVRYREPAYRIAFRITGRDEDAWDVVQDAFIRAFDSLDSFQREAGFKTWFTRIVSNRALDLLRARKVRSAISIERAGDDSDHAATLDITASAIAGRDADEDVSAGAQRADLRTQLNAAIDSLPDDQRVAFMLYAEGEYSYAEIAEIVGIPIGTVMSRIFYARKRLEKQLAKLAPGGGGAS